jgi:predicted molibdopterin-dependent oxidoreductase YjgC
MNTQDKQVREAAALFRALADDHRPVTVDLDGKPVAACEFDTVASLLLRVADPRHYRRSSASGARRAPLCMMGVCFECLVEIDGQTNQQGCLVRVRDGMQIKRQMRRRQEP